MDVNHIQFSCILLLKIANTKYKNPLLPSFPIHETRYYCIPSVMSPIEKQQRSETLSQTIQTSIKIENTVLKPLAFLVNYNEATVVGFNHLACSPH